jgi:hypothetical protein
LQEFAGLQQSLAQLVVPLGFPLENADLTPKNEDFLGDFLGFLRISQGILNQEKSVCF